MRVKSVEEPSRLSSTVIGYDGTMLSGGTSPLSPEVPIHVEAKGATVPEFELEVLPAAEVEVTTSLAGGVAVGQSLEVRWPSSNAEYVEARLGGGSRLIRCFAKASKGSIVIPSEHVAKVAADAKDGLELTIQISRTKSGRFGDFNVSLRDNAKANR